MSWRLAGLLAYGIIAAVVGITSLSCCGSDLENYLHNTFYCYFGTPDRSLGNIRDIEFWSWLVALNE